MGLFGSDDGTGPATPFFWGQNGARMTPDLIAAQRKVADAMAAQGAEGSPFPAQTQGFGLLTQGLNRVAKGVMAGLDYREADNATKANAEENTKLIAALLGGGAAPAAAASPATAAPSAAPAAAPAGLDPETTGYVNNAASKYGVDPAYLTRTAMIESGGNPNSVNKASGASGLFQFMPKTAKEYELANPLDPEDSAMAAAELAKDNRDSLKAALGRDPTNAELYLAHQQGAGGAAALLANPNAPAISVLGPNGRAAVMNNGGNERMTAGQFANMWLNKYNQGVQPPAAEFMPGNTPVVASDAETPAPAAPAPGVAKVAAVMPGAPAAAPPVTPAAPGPAAPLAAPAAPPVAKVSGALPAVTAATGAAPTAGNARVAAALQAFTSPYADPATKQVAGMVLTQAMKPTDTHTQEIDKDGNVWDVNKQTGQKTIALKSDADPKWGVVGKDQYGQPTYGYPPTREDYEAAQKAKVATPASDQPDLMNVHGKEYLDTIAKQDPKYASQVQAIIEGRAPYPTGMLLKTPYGQKLAQDVTQADPSFESGNATARVKVRNEFEAGGVGSPAGQISAGNTAIQHAGEMSDALERLKGAGGTLTSVGESGIPFISYYANKLHNAAVQGTPEGKALNDFLTAKNHFAEEVTKFYAGSAGSEAERTRALANLDAAKSLPELRSAIKTEANLMQGKVNALQDRWRKGMGPLVPDYPLIDKPSQGALDRIMQRDAPAPAAPVAPAAPAADPAAVEAEMRRRGLLK